jgi:hypothetical protein
VTTTSATAGQYGASVLGLHAFPEPVRFRALAIVGLKCTFRHLRFLLFGSAFVVLGAKRSQMR